MPPGRPKNEEIRKNILKALKKGPLSRAQIATAVGQIGEKSKLPLVDMRSEGLIVMTGERQTARYSLPAKSTA